MTIDHLFKNHSSKISKCQLQCFEIYNEKIFDLLREDSLGNAITADRAIFTVE